MSEDKSIVDKAQELAKDVAEKAKDVAVTAKEKVSGFVGEHEEQIHSRIERTGDFVDDKTKGRFSEKIDKAQDAAKGAVSKLGSTPDGPEEGTAQAAEPAELSESSESTESESTDSGESTDSEDSKD